MTETIERESQGWIRGLTDRRTWTRVGYLLATFPMGIFWFVALVTLISAGVSLIIIWIGLPILWFTFLLSRNGAQLERRFVEWGLGTNIEVPYRSEPAAPLRKRWLVRLGDPATWRDLVYLVLLFPLGIVWFTILSIVFALPLALIATPLTMRWWEPFSFTGEGWRWLVIDTTGEALIAAAVGVLLLLVVPVVVRGMAALHGAMASGLLGPTESARLSVEVRGLRVSRDQGLDAAEYERRQIERNLHDGAQQRLVALAMGLGMAKEKLDSDPEAARRLVDEAHEHAKQAIVELRDLARGISPAVLTDRGLDAALSALARPWRARMISSDSRRRFSSRATRRWIATAQISPMPSGWTRWYARTKACSVSRSNRLSVWAT
ncbi:MAG: sensor domain-containing protein [Acidimicrobiia bacterium]|nr:sensor domain-containing protein [Acidimicrobiia bacterium]